MSLSKAAYSALGVLILIFGATAVAHLSQHVRTANALSAEVGAHASDRNSDVKEVFLLLN